MGLGHLGTFCTTDAPAHSHLDLGRGQTVTIVMDPLEELLLLKILGLDQDKLGPEGLHLGWEVFTPLAPVHVSQNWN